MWPECQACRGEGCATVHFEVGLSRARNRPFAQTPENQPMPKIVAVRLGYV